MGFTQYYRIKEGEISQEVWLAFLKDVKAVIKAMPKTVTDERDSYYQAPLSISGCFKYDKPKFTKNMIWFNGCNGLKRINNKETITTGKDKGKSYTEWKDAEHKNEDWNDLSHETFTMYRKNVKESWESDEKKDYTFRFCKTQRKPYNFAVMAVLILAKYHFKADIHISSDGEYEIWKPCLAWVCKIHNKCLGLLMTDKLLED